MDVAMMQQDWGEMTLSRRRFLKMCVSTAVAVSGSQLLMTLGTSSGLGERLVPVLAYHRVGFTTSDLTVSLQRFKNDLQQLKADGYTSITLQDFMRFIDDKNVELPEKPVLITFDDGYQDNYEHAFPILEQFGMVGSFFVITGMLGQPERVTPEQVKEMARHGMSIGSHTVSHRALAELSAEEASLELTMSKATLEDLLGAEVSAIAYPRGSYSEETIAIGKSCGYNAGFTVKEGTCIKHSPDFELSRIPVFRFDGNLRQILRKRAGLGVG
ncbi:polysaccharide deacetylase family protein [Azotosporobacter soli]|uniref:polysaccharide deacetylase family protein n=1 Tax=Azotosporobacter soli TaxID=3055040 RepID=UPI0031FE8F12